MLPINVGTVWHSQHNQAATIKRFAVAAAAIPNYVDGSGIEEHYDHRPSEGKRDKQPLDP